MIIFIEEGISFFVYKDREETIADYASFCSEMYVCNTETDAIRRHLLLQVGIVDWSYLLVKGGDIMMRLFKNKAREKQQSMKNRLLSDISKTRTQAAVEKAIEEQQKQK